jgi:hypothetical protein
MLQTNDQDKNYLFSIEAVEDTVFLKYKNKEVITIDEKGAKFGAGHSSIGENSYFEEAYTTDETYIGCNIVIT